MTNRDMARKIFDSALDAANPFSAVAQRAGDIKSIYEKGGFNRLIVAGFGKGAFAMARAAEETLGDILERGIIVTKYGHAGQHPLKKIKTLEAAHPVPDENGRKAAEEIFAFLKTADERTLVLCLISGGGSALLVAPVDGIALEEKKAITQLLLKSGATIHQVNAVRKHISKIKGGRLAEAAYPAKIISLIVSDVLGNSLDVISSGPTAPDNSRYADALAVLDSFDITGSTPKGVLDVLRNGAAGFLPETPKPGCKIFSRVENIVIASNLAALTAARDYASNLGLNARIISESVQGDVADAAHWLAQCAIEAKASHEKRPICLISGGETTVKVRGSGVGGRNMELALIFALQVQKTSGITLLSAGTDGSDGPTDATGAIVCSTTVPESKEKGLDANSFLENNDSYNFFSKAEGLLKTGSTGTNVMDIQIVIVGE